MSSRLVFFFFVILNAYYEKPTCCRLWNGSVTLKIFFALQNVCQNHFNDVGSRSAELHVQYAAGDFGSHRRVNSVDPMQCCKSSCNIWLPVDSIKNLFRGGTTGLLPNGVNCTLISVEYYRRYTLKVYIDNSRAPI